MSGPSKLEDLARLDQVTRRLRRECPWDREQDERSIVPHTVEEAYELADAAQTGDDAKLIDELGDVLFQVVFLSLLLEERGAGGLAEVARLSTDKLIRRHPHVFGDAQVQGAEDVLRNWDEIKRTEPGREGGPFGDVPENLPSLLRARKVQRRAAAAGIPLPDERGADAQVRHHLPKAGFEALGDLLFAVVNIARIRRLDPELALRDSTRRFLRAHENPGEATTR